MMRLAHTSYFVQVLAERRFGLISSFPISCLLLVSCEELPSDIRKHHNFCAAFAQIGA